MLTKFICLIEEKGKISVESEKPSPLDFLFINFYFMTTDSIRRYVVVGSRRLSNYVWASISFIVGFDFLLTGISSYNRTNLLPIIHAENIGFFPQGLVMCFYGVLSLLFSFYIVLTIVWGIGGGFNIFDKVDRQVRVFRWGWPGKNRIIDLLYSMDEIKGVRLDVQQGLTDRRTIYLCVHNSNEVPLTRVGQPLTLEETEKLAWELAQFLEKDLVE